MSRNRPTGWCAIGSPRTQHRQTSLTSTIRLLADAGMTSCEGPFVAIFDLDTCRVDAVSLAGPAIGAPRARRKHSVRCDGDLRQVRLMAEDASASDLEPEPPTSSRRAPRRPCALAARATTSSASRTPAARCAGYAWRLVLTWSEGSRRCAHRVQSFTSSARHSAPWMPPSSGPKRPQPLPLPLMRLRAPQITSRRLLLPRPEIPQRQARPLPRRRPPPSSFLSCS